MVSSPIKTLIRGGTVLMLLAECATLRRRLSLVKFSLHCGACGEPGGGVLNRFCGVISVVSMLVVTLQMRAWGQDRASGGQR